MKRVWELALLVLAAIVAGAIPAFAQGVYAPGVELQNYFSNASTTGGQAYVNIIAPLEGDTTGPSAAVREGETCAMIYVLDTDQALQTCCGCPITADGLLTLSISGNLAPNPLATGQLLHDGSIRILSAAPNATFNGNLVTPPFESCDTVNGVCCDPTGSGGSEALTPVHELVAWATHVQNTQITEQVFEVIAGSLTFDGAGNVHPDTPVELDPDFANLPESCADTIRLGSGQGFCTCGSPVSG